VTTAPSAAHLSWAQKLGITTIIFANLIMLFFVGLLAYDVYSRPEPLIIKNNQELSTFFDAYKERADGLQKLVTVLIGLSSLYAIVLGVTSYINAQQYVKQFDYEIGKAREEVAKAVEQNKAASDETARLKTQFPTFDRIEARIARMVDRLQQLLPDTEWLQDHINDLSTNEREEILLYERSAAFCVLLNPEGLQEKAADLFRRLCRYYRARYSVERKALLEKQRILSLAGRPGYFFDAQKALGNLLDRARIYIDLAFPDPKHFVRLNEEAIIQWEQAGHVDDIASRSLFLESLKRHPRQQRAHYWLSILEHVSGNYAVAESRLTEALSEENWETIPRLERKPDIFYNRACARSRLGENQAEGPAKERYADAAAQDLLAACPGPNKVSLFFFKQDISPSGDLAWLKAKRGNVVTTALLRLSGEG
jgi:hypothetical protein